MKTIIDRLVVEVQDLLDEYPQIQMPEEGTEEENHVVNELRVFFTNLVERLSA